MDSDFLKSDILKPEAERDMIQQWVKTWRNASRELEAIRRHEADVVPAQEAVRQLFEGMDSVLVGPAPANSGLVELQMWFSRIRAGAERGKPESNE